MEAVLKIQLLNQMGYSSWSLAFFLSLNYAIDVGPLTILWKDLAILYFLGVVVGDKTFFWALHFIFRKVTEAELNKIEKPGLISPDLANFH